jgi:hypothetical protein
MKSEADRSVTQYGNLVGPVPTNLSARCIGGAGDAILRREEFDNFSIVIQNLDAQFPVYRICIHEKMHASELDRARDEFAAGLARVPRGKAVAPQEGDVGAAAGIHVTRAVRRNAGEAAIVRIGPVADNRTDTARRPQVMAQTHGSWYPSDSSPLNCNQAKAISERAGFAGSSRPQPDGGCSRALPAAECRLRNQHAAYPG